MIAPDDAISIAATTIGLPRARRPADVPPSIPDYRFIKVIGRGAFGMVWLAEEPLAGVFRAIKILDGGGRPRKDRAHLTNRELEGLHAFQTRVQCHPHLIQISKTGLCTMSRLPAEGEGQGEGPSPQAPGLKPQASVYYVMEIADHAGGAQPFRPADYRPLTLAEVLRRKGRLPLDAGEVPPLRRGGGKEGLQYSAENPFSAAMAKSASSKPPSPSSSPSSTCTRPASTTATSSRRTSSSSAAC